MSTSRRIFGQKVLGTAAGLGLNTVSAGGVLGRTVAAGGLMAAVATASEAAAYTERVPALVIGTGYGGAVTALRLAERGIPVTMLEMGRLWNTPGKDGKVYCTLFSMDERAMWFNTKLTAVLSSFLRFPLSLKVPYGPGILDVQNHEGMDVYMGRGVGGGSLVNMAMLITPQSEVLKDLMPQGFDVDDFLKRIFPRAKDKLGANTIRREYFEKSPYQRYARVMRDNIAKAGYTSDLKESGYDFNYMEREEAGQVPKSALGFEGGFGNNHGKASLDKNYLADAVGTGLVTIHSMTSVKKIERDTDGTYIVTCEEIDPLGNVVRRYAIGCERLFMAGGSMGTTELLVRARDTGALPLLNSAVGTHWSANSDIFTVSGNPIWNPTGGKQSMVPASGFYSRDQNNDPMYTMAVPLPLAGIETWCNMSITMTRNREVGTFRYDAAKDRAILSWGNRNEPAVKSTKFVFDRIHKAARTSYRSDFFSGKDMADNATYHPVGGVPLGKATDLYGRVAGYDKLYVMDSSLIPGALVANPALTVAALAERNIERILQTDF